MSKKGLIALASCILALCLALVGCGGSGGSGGKSEDPAVAAKKAFTGTWDMVEMTQGDDVTGPDDIETLKALGMEVYLNLNEDGTADFVIFGEPVKGTWKASSPTAGTLELGTSQLDMTISDSQLKFEQEGSTITFKKGEAKAAPSSAAGDGSSAETSSESSSSANAEQSSTSS